MKKRTFLLITCLFLLLNCSKKSKLASNHPTLQLIDVTEIYDEDLAENAVKAATDENRQEANKVFLRALDLYRNKKQPGTSLGHFRMSLAICPTAKVYYELGNALMDTRNYEEALSSYRMAERFQYSPHFKVLYNIACANSRILNREDALDYLAYALQEGYTNKENLLKDKDLENIRQEKTFTALIVEFFQDAQDQKKILFDLYLQGFKNSSLPFVLDENEVNDFDYKRAMSYDFSAFVADMENSRFARDVVNEYMYGEILAKTDSLIILTYVSHNSMGDTLAPNLTYLATYDQRGKLLDTKVIGGNVSGTEFMTGEVNGAFVVKTVRYSRIWKENPLEKSYAENTHLRNTALRNDFYHIDPKGMIVAGDVAIGPPQE